MADEQGWLTSDDVDMNTVLYGYVLPREEVYNFEASIDLRAAWTHDGDERQFEFRVNQVMSQELGPGGKPDSRRVIWGKKNRDVRKFGIGFGYTLDWLVRAKRSVDDILAHQRMCFQADRETVRAVILDVIMDTATQYGLYNGYFHGLENMTTPPRYGQNTFVRAHTHYVTTGTAALTTLTSLTAARQDMREHGRNGPYGVWCNSETLKDVEDMAAWNIRASGNQPTPNVVIDEVARSGFQGRMLGFDWFVNEMIPADYLIVVDMGVARDFMRFVEVENAMWKGLVHLSSDESVLRPGAQMLRRGSYPIVDSFYLRWFNAYVIMRDAAVVIQVTSSSTFTRPNVTSNIIEVT